jgi:cob(I)alamin adenosyltransferase
MKIATKTGDKGDTGLLYGGRHPKHEKVFDAMGDLDELSAFIGMAKVKIMQVDNLTLERFYDVLESIQKDIIAVMGELNCKDDGELTHYITKFDPLKESSYVKIDEEVSFLQDMEELKQKHWVLYGKSETGSILDVCSKVCRRAERSYWRFNESNSYGCRELLGRYINRLSDFLYLVARLADCYSR